MKKVPVVIIDPDKINIEDYIISKTVIRRNITKTQRAVLAVEWIFRQKQNDEKKDEELFKIFKIAGKKFGVSKSLISVVFNIKKEASNIFLSLKEGLISYEQALKYYNKKDEVEYTVIEEFSSLPGDLQEYLKKVPFNVQEEIYNKIINSIEVRNAEKFSDIENNFYDNQEIREEIKELTNKYFEAKEKEKKIKEELKQAKKYQEKLENIVQSLRSLIKELNNLNNENNENFKNFDIETADKSELTDLIGKLNELKKKLNMNEDIDIKEIPVKNEADNNISSREDLSRNSELYSHFLNFTAVFNDYAKGRVITILRELNAVDKNTYNQIFYFLNELYDFLEVLFKELSEMAIKSKKIDNADKFLIVK